MNYGTIDLSVAEVTTLKGSEISVILIGSVDENIDNGSDQYVLVTRKDDDLTPAQAIQYLTERYFDEGSGPGAYFCHTVLAVQVQHSTNQCICTINHRYDV